VGVVADTGTRPVVAGRGSSTEPEQLRMTVGAVAAAVAVDNSVFVGAVVDVDSDDRAPHIPSHCRVPY